MKVPEGENIILVIGDPYIGRLAEAMAAHPNAEIITVAEAQDRGIIPTYEIRNRPIIAIPDEIKTVKAFFGKASCKRPNIDPTKKPRRW